MSTPKFKHRENKSYETSDGTIWFSRSVAVLGIVIVQHGGKLYVLSGKRSQKMDAPGLWCVPCGYMDWDETGLEAITREIYEESSLYLPDFNLCNIRVPMTEHPFYVHTLPNENRQNITLSYAGFYSFNKNEKNFQELNSKLESFKSDEVDETKLIPYEEILNYDWAFEHEERIVQGAEYIKSHLSNKLDSLFGE